MTFIYQGPGVLQSCAQQAQSLFKASKLLSYDDLLNTSWEQEARCFVLPGGADLPYVEKLQGEGNRKISSFVHKGGTFIGICAGGYYGGAYVEFAKGTLQEIIGPRELAFFPGTVEGPHLAPYDAESSSGVRAAEILWNNQRFYLYYNGGGCFKNPPPQVKVIARYADTGEAAIVECIVGLGKAILSGVHFEFDPSVIEVENSAIHARLMASESLRKELIQIVV